MTIAAERLRRRGYGLIELTICSLLFLVAMGLMVQTTAWVAVERRGSERRQVALQEAANLMERLADRPFEALTPESAGSIKLSDHAGLILRNGSVNVAIVAAPGDLASKRITIEIRWRDQSGAPVAPVRLVAWVHRRGGIKA